MIKALFSMYLPSFPLSIVYMLQSTEYQPKAYIEWVWRTNDFTSVMKRRKLDRTRAARLLVLAMRLGMLLQVLVGAWLVYMGAYQDYVGGLAFGLAVIIATPLTWAHLIILPLLLGRWLISGPAAQKQITASEKIFAKHPGVKIAVAGSYGKTTMKELLYTVLSEGLKVAATPANKNVSSSHARFAKSLTGKEDVLIIEYGEGAPGDVTRFAELTHPTHAIVTGLAPAHLDQYKTMQAAGEDIFSVADHVKNNHVYVNGDSPRVQPFLQASYEVFNGKSVLDWKISAVKVTLEGTSFTLTKGSKKLSLKSELVGEHQVGFVAFVAAFALQLGLTNEQVKAGVAKTKPFEHRMQPYRLGGAWIVDDTYNGNLEGIRAGTALLKRLKAKRKIYVTPGLVDQGEETKLVHTEIGELIAAAEPDLVVLMQNSVTNYISDGLKKAGFAGEIRVELNPLEFYTNLNHFVAKDDLVVMQNDWTDNYV